MTQRSAARFLGRLFVSALVLASSASAETITGKVVRILDGDTLVILDAANAQHKIRMIGIDAPEKKQAFGAYSKENLSGLVFGKTVIVESAKRDLYQRELGKILSDGKDVNLLQIESGLAWFYVQYEHDQTIADRKLYADAEAKAKIDKIGLWSGYQPVAPWVFRKQKPTTK
jgi:endonuclease YncB( thermonuclease family)